MGERMCLGFEGNGDRAAYEVRRMMDGRVESVDSLELAVKMSRIKGDARSSTLAPRMCSVVRLATCAVSSKLF